jgi:hypothetical protein
MINRSSHDLTHTGFGRVAKTIKIPSQDSWLQNRDLKSGRPEYEAESYPLNCGIHLGYFLAYIKKMFTTRNKNKIVMQVSYNSHITLIQLSYFLIFFFVLKNEYQYNTLSLPEKRQTTHILPSFDKPMESLALSQQSPASARVS